MNPGPSGMQCQLLCLFFWPEKVVSVIKGWNVHYQSIFCASDLWHSQFWSPTYRLLVIKPSVEFPPRSRLTNLMQPSSPTRGSSSTIKSYVSKSIWEHTFLGFPPQIFCSPRVCTLMPDWAIFQLTLERAVASALHISWLPVPGFCTLAQRGKLPFFFVANGEVKIFCFSPESVNKWTY